MVSPLAKTAIALVSRINLSITGSVKASVPKRHNYE